MKLPARLAAGLVCLCLAAPASAVTFRFDYFGTPATLGPGEEEIYLYYLETGPEFVFRDLPTDMPAVNGSFVVNAAFLDLSAPRNVSFGLYAEIGVSGPDDYKCITSPVTAPRTSQTCWDVGDDTAFMLNGPGLGANFNGIVVTFDSVALQVLSWDIFSYSEAEDDYFSGPGGSEQGIVVTDDGGWVSLFSDTPSQWVVTRDPPAPIPLPAGLPLLAAALGALALLRRRRR